MTLPSPLPNLSSFAVALTHAEVEVDRLVFDEKGTICSPNAKTASQERSLQVLTGDGAGEILLKGSLSKGGMGTILLAEQYSIGRDVAVKVAAANKRGTIAEAELVVEARVAGQLEHPNIVPVHMLGITADNKPIIVMKRIEGESWQQILHQEHKAGTRGARELLRDVEILADVCRALHFAHSRGVVHRDVKPANVMVGSFGEVYLLDWGIAVGFGDDALPDLPHASSISTVSGTPQYMAPEMALPNSGTVDQRTDVFLVGAVLYELLTGAAPYQGETLEEMLFAAHTASAPAFPDDAPEELVEICQRAMQRDPRDRFQSTEEMRVALHAFQTHAVARELCAAAEERLAQLEELAVDDPACQRAFTECRFGFAQALRTWPESVRAREGLERAIVGMARRELDAGHLDSARALVSELAQVPPALTAALDEAQHRQERDAENLVTLKRIAHESDARIGSPERAAVVFVAGVLWLASMLLVYWLARAGIYEAGAGSFALPLLVIAIMIAGAGVAFPKIRETASARSLYFTMLICDLSILCVFLAGWRLELPPNQLLAFGHTFLAATIAILASQDGRLWGATLLAAAVVPGVLAFPDAAYPVSGVGAFLALSAWAKRWRELQ